MNSILKFLIAAACVCVIAVSGHYAYTLYKASADERLRIELAKERARAITEEQKQQHEAELARRKEDAAERRKAFLKRVEERKLKREQQTR